MGKRKRQGATGSPPPASDDKPATLKDLVGADVLARLKAQAEELRQHEAEVRERQRLDEERRRKEEQKRLDNNFEHLLNNSGMDWKKFK
ncbi:YqkE family protein [Paenibacillus sp. TRM 82003]|nr:YqkE family protein [Paenibacillus sp. TRM 82003]